MDIERLVKGLVYLSKFFHLHMYFIKPKSTGGGKRRKTASEKTDATANIQFGRSNREYILFGNVQFISIIDFPKPGMNSFSLIGICFIHSG
jgi:hypothetical protein